MLLAIRIRIRTELHYNTKIYAITFQNLNGEILNDPWAQLRLHTSCPDQPARPGNVPHPKVSHSGS